MNFAGKYLGPARDFARGVASDPRQSAIAAGAAGAGLATLGNISSGEARQEGPTRLGLEALGAGALGAAAGAAMPQMRGRMGAAISEGLDKTMRQELKRKKGVLATPDAAMMQGADRASQVLSQGVPAVAAGVGLTGAAGLGGLVGGGAGNIGAMMNVPGIDPEAPGSSNTINSRLTMQGYAPQRMA